MAGKRGTKRRASGAAATSKSTKRRKRANDDEYPSDLPSRKLTFDHCEWLNDYQIEYESRVGKRGAKDSAYAWVRSTIGPKFLDKFFPTLSPAIRERFKPYIDKVINTRFNNNAHPKSKNLFDPTVFGKLTRLEHLWGRENQDQVDKVWIPMIKEKPELRGRVDKFRSVVCDLFKVLPDDVRELYSQKFQDRKRDMQSGTVPEDQKAQYVGHLMKKVDAMFREAERQAGVFFEGNLGVVTNGLLDIHRISTPLGKAFLTSEQGISSHALVQGWLITNLDTFDARPIPARAVIPVREEGMRPQLPDRTEHRPTLQLTRSWVRTVFASVYQLTGGANRVPYKEIEDAIANGDYSWIPKECIPEGAPFKEPGYMTLEQTLVWLDKFEGWRLGSKTFYFTQVYTVDRKAKPSVDQASSREPATRNGVPVWLAKYTAPVTAPQNVRPVYYPSRSWDYFYYLQDGRGASSDPALGRDHWNGLPSRTESDMPLPGQIGAEEREAIDRTFAGCADEVRKTVRDLIDAVNKMETVAPVWTDHGLWTKPEDNPVNTLPRVLPMFEPSNLTGLSYWLDFWLDIAYFMAPKAGLEFSRLDYLEAWLVEQLKCGPSFHEKSGTLVGGWNGIVWIVRAILKVLANAGATVSSLGVEPGSPLPAGYDPRRLGIAYFEHALEWVKTWADAIKSCTIVLEPSSAERWQPADFEAKSQPLAEPNPFKPTSDVEPTSDDDQPVASGSRSRRQSNRRLKVGDDDDMDLLEAKAEREWEQKSESEEGSWEGGKSSASVESESEAGAGSEPDSEPIVGKGKAPVRGEKAPAKAGGGSSKAKDEASAKARAKTSAKVRHSQPTDTPANRQTRQKNSKSSSTLSSKRKKEARAWLMRSEWAQHATPEELACLESYVTHWGGEELRWKEEAEQAAQDFKIYKANALEALANGTLGENVAKLTRTPAVHREIHDRIVLNWQDKTSALWTEPPPYQSQKCVADADRLPPLLVEFIQTASKILDDWTTHYDYWVRANNELLLAAARFSDKQTDFPAVEFTIALHAAYWTQCRHADKGTSEDLPALHQLEYDINHELATGSALLRRMNVLEQAGSLLDLSDHTKDQARELAFRLRLLYDQIRGLKSLALSWRNRLKDRFRYPLTPFSLEELVDIGGMLEQWTGEANALCEKQDQDSLQRWIAAELYDSLRPRPCVFRCGNPIAYGFSQEAKTQLQVAIEVLQNRAATAKALETSTIDTPVPKPRKRPPMKRPTLPTTDTEPHAAGPSHEAEQARPELEINTIVPVTCDPSSADADNGRTIVEQPVNGNEEGEEIGGPENNGVEGEGGKPSAASSGDSEDRVPATGAVESASKEIAREGTGGPGDEGGEGTTSEEVSGPGNEGEIGGEPDEPEDEGGAGVGTKKTGKSSTRKNVRKTTAPKTPSSRTASKGKKSTSTPTAAVVDSGSTGRVTRHSIAGSTPTSTVPGRTLRDRTTLTAPSCR
ncbi:hypothetical protein FRC08_010771 [Ceratobasidium sp. 394]|nr:hypothetical protein FRC08_010771 [Ceratobasidium sp. 394]